MWLYIIALALVILGIAGGALMGGIFTIVLVPLAAIVLLTALLTHMWGRAAQGSASGAEATEPGERPLPTRRRPGAGRVATSPEGLADARRAQQ